MDFVGISIKLLNNVIANNATLSEEEVLIVARGFKDLAEKYNSETLESRALITGYITMMSHIIHSNGGEVRIKAEDKFADLSNLRPFTSTDPITGDFVVRLEKITIANTQSN